MVFLGALAAPQSDLYAAELVLGEIFANTVEHAPGLVEITIDWTESYPTLSARDRGPGMASGPTSVPLDPLSENGRGLFLMTALARDVRVETPGGGGTRIVATLPIERRPRGVGRTSEVA